MNILFDINHPAHVHLFKNAIKILKEQGNNVLVTSRDKDVTLQLLDAYKIEHICLSKAQKGLFRLGIELITRQVKLFPILRKNKIQVCVSATGACSVHVCKLLGIPTLVFYDTEHASLQNNIAIPFATKYITPEAYNKRHGRNHITYKGFHDLAYLHPKYFQQDETILDILGLKKGEKFIILRFVSWQAAHDIGQNGIDIETKREIIKICSQHGRVIINSEENISEDFKKYACKIPPEKMLDALYYASLYIGEGGSMATEAATLGTPAIFINSLNAGVLAEMENSFGLMFSFVPSDKDAILTKAKELLSEKNKDIWKEKRDNLINNTINLTDYMVQQIKDYDTDN